MNNKDVWVCNGVEFSAGDAVRVSRFTDSFAKDGMGDGIVWDNSWLDGDMDQAIGGEFVIAEIVGSEGALLENFVDDASPKPHFEFLFPLSSLDRIAG